MSHVQRFDHVGITVADLDTATAFFVGLGLEIEGTRMFVEARVPGHRDRHPGLAHRDRHAAAPRRWNPARALELRQARSRARIARRDGQ